ncbi:hypothetical protein [Geofilum rubicundum]|nr:hypothetical protein [Geofilum rubicundum]
MELLLAGTKGGDYIVGCDCKKKMSDALDIFGLKIRYFTRLPLCSRDAKMRFGLWFLKCKIMEAANLNINLPLNFNQVVDLVRQLPYNEKLKLSEVLKKETKQKKENNNILTHFASEKVLAKDWLLPEEDEAWKDL